MVAVADHGARQAVLVRLNIISDLFAERGLKHFELGLSSGAGAADVVLPTLEVLLRALMDVVDVGSNKIVLDYGV